MQQQTWQIQQQLQRVQQLCTETVQVNQQVVQELQHIQQQVGQISNVPTNVGAYQQQQPAFYGPQSSTALNAVMQADRQAGIQESQPSYRNYNTQVPQYSPTQSLNYGAPAYGTSSSNASIQSVMKADQQYSMMGSRSPYGTISSMGSGY